MLHDDLCLTFMTDITAQEAYHTFTAKSPHVSRSFHSSCPELGCDHGTPEASATPSSSTFSEIHSSSSLTSSSLPSPCSLSHSSFLAEISFTDSRGRRRRTLHRKKSSSDLRDDFIHAGRHAQVVLNASTPIMNEFTGGVD
ncbi:hypothetical protein AX17_004172 [Amanita inopinata Kibby_2008]|nr:hypothetical protein AX17_004172 [Amanita inopinata Kibby_2008]